MIEVFIWVFQASQIDVSTLPTMDLWIFHTAHGSLPAFDTGKRKE